MSDKRLETIVDVEYVTPRLLNGQITIFRVRRGSKERKLFIDGCANLSIGYEVKIIKENKGSVLYGRTGEEKIRVVTEMEIYNQKRLVGRYFVRNLSGIRI